MYGLNNEQPKCGNQAPHMFHTTTVEIMKPCDGRAFTECGEIVVLHEPHEVHRVIEDWCDGVCMCVNHEGKHDHGPGRHK